MSDFLEKLLDGADVEWKSLWEVTIWDKKFNAVDNLKQPKVRKYHYFLSKEITPLISENGTVKILTTNVSNMYTTENLAGDKVANGEVIAIPWGGNPVVQYYKGKFITSDNRIATSNNVNFLDNKYLYYFMLNNLRLIASFYRGSGIKHPSMSAVLDMKIPIPPLSIQNEIVRILDTFTATTAELTAELSTRKKQYQYYREQLFNLDESLINYLPMGDESVGKFIRGGGLQKKDFTEQGVGCIHYGQIYTQYGTYTHKTKTFVSEEFAKKARKAQKGDLVIATTSENDEDLCKAVAWLGEDDIAISSDACFYKHNLNSKYVSYFFQTELFQKQKRKYITGTKVRRVNADNLAKILIPIPPLEKQAEIVAILDKFDTLTNSISEGLPKEIELRQKQYEYYRDALLSFPKPDEVEA